MAKDHRICPRCHNRLMPPRYERVAHELVWKCGSCGFVRRVNPLNQPDQAELDEPARKE